MRLTTAQRRIHITQLCAERSITIWPEGVGLRLVGDGVNLFVCDLADIRPADL